MENERFYVIVPQTVQILHPAPPLRDEFDIQGVDEITSVPMVHGRLIAQGVHVGRIIGHYFASRGIPYRDVTTITLAVRNSKELRKVSNELRKTAETLLNADIDVGYEEFHDHNPGLYNTLDRVHTITIVGPVQREMVEDGIGHLELY